jgi:tetratricopeptide (TPR) repeat protein
LELGAPPIVADPSRGAAERVRALLEFAREQGLRRGGRELLVVVLAPLEVADEGEYAAFVREILALEAGRPPWFRRIRLLVAAPAGGLGVLGELPPWATTIKVDLSLAAMTASVEEAAAASNEPPERRAWATLQAAALAATRGEVEAARAQLHGLLASIQSLEGPAAAAKATLQAMALSGLGDVARLEGDRSAAIAWYERALVPAGEACAAILLLALARQLAPLYLEVGRAAEAEAFHDGAQRLAILVPDLGCHLEALRSRAGLEARRGAIDEAARTLITAVEAARESDADARWLRDLLPELAALRGRVSPACDQAIAAQLTAEARPAGGA